MDLVCAPAWVPHARIALRLLTRTLLSLSVLLSDAKSLIGNQIVCEHGHHFLALNARGQDKGRHAKIRKLFNRAMLELRLVGINMQLSDEIKVLETNIWRTNTELNRINTSFYEAMSAAGADAPQVTPQPVTSPRASFVSAGASGDRDDIADRMRLQQRLKSLNQKKQDRLRMRQDIHDQLQRQGVYEPSSQNSQHPGVSEIDMPKQTLINTILSAESDLAAGIGAKSVKQHGLRSHKRKALTLADTKDYPSLLARTRDAGVAEIELEIAGIRVKSRLDKSIVKQASFVKWWRRQRWLVKEYTHRYARLAKIWRSMVGTTGDEGLRVWKVRAVLLAVWEEEANTSVKARSEFHRRLIAWLHEYDRDSSGSITRDQFGLWFVVQSESILARVWNYKWEELETRYDKNAMLEEFGSVLSEVERDIEGLDNVDTEDEKHDRERMSNREKELESMLDELDSEIHEREGDPVRRHQTAYGVLGGGARQPLLRTRLRLIRTLRSQHEDTLAALKSGGSTSSCGRCWHRITKEEVLRDHRLLSTAAVDMMDQDSNRKIIATETVGEMLGDFYHVHTHRCCCDLYWIHDLKLWWKMHVMDWLVHQMDAHLHNLERSFGHGVAEILRACQVCHLAEPCTEHHLVRRCNCAT